MKIATKLIFFHDISNITHNSNQAKLGYTLLSPPQQLPKYPHLLPNKPIPLLHKIFLPNFQMLQYKPLNTLYILPFLIISSQINLSQYLLFFI